MIYLKLWNLWTLAKTFLHYWKKSRWLASSCLTDLSQLSSFSFSNSDFLSPNLQLLLTLSLRIAASGFTSVWQIFLRSGQEKQMSWDCGPYRFEVRVVIGKGRLGWGFEVTWIRSNTQCSVYSTNPSEVCSFSHWFFLFFISWPLLPYSTRYTHTIFHSAAFFWLAWLCVYVHQYCPYEKCLDKCLSAFISLILTSGHTHQGNPIWKRHVHPSVHHSTVYHSQDMEAT